MTKGCYFWTKCAEPDSIPPVLLEVSYALSISVTGAALVEQGVCMCVFSCCVVFDGNEGMRDISHDIILWRVSFKDTQLKMILDYGSMMLSSPWAKQVGTGGVMSALWRHFKMNDDDKSRADFKLFFA